MFVIRTGKISLLDMSHSTVGSHIFSCKGAALEVLMSVCLSVRKLEFPSSRRFQKVPEGSRRFQKLPEASRSFQKHPEGSRKFSKVPKVTKG